MIVICDIDGTAANIEHRRKWVIDKPKNWIKFFGSMDEDEPNYWCQEILKSLQESGHYIQFVTGRPANYRKVTEDWLRKYYGQVFDSTLLMRAEGDRREDFVVKEEIYNKYLKDQDILCVIDDRTQVVDMWRKNGITVLQCDKGDF